MKKCYGAWLFIALLITCTISAVASSRQDILVEVKWLQENHARNDVLILDVREHQKYLAGHIPGAVNIPVAKTFSPHSAVAKVASLEHISGLLSRSGIRNRHFIVVYDNGRYIDAARMFWVLETYGHSRISLLNGAWPAWVAGGFSISDNHEKRPRSKYVARVNPDRLASKLQTHLAIYNKDKAIIDSRSKDEYVGHVSKIGRKGRIPSAISVPHEKNFFSKDGVQKLRPNHELSSLYSPVAEADKVITYCNKGKQSSLTYFVLRGLGVDVSHYDGSWSEWGNDDTLPIERGEDKKEEANKRRHDD